MQLGEWAYNALNLGVFRVTFVGLLADLCKG